MWVRMQWFVSVEGFRQAALDAIHSVQWLPASGHQEDHEHGGGALRLVHQPAALLGRPPPRPLLQRHRCTPSGAMTVQGLSMLVALIGSFIELGGPLLQSEQCNVCLLE